MGFHGDVYMVLAQRHFAASKSDFFMNTVIHNDFIAKMTKPSDVMILFDFCCANIHLPPPRYNF